MYSRRMDHWKTVLEYEFINVVQSKINGGEMPPNWVIRSSSLLDRVGRLFLGEYDYNSKSFWML